ncbi:DUF3883 domain-containing protein [Chryseobacterium lacus]|jgi:hypothetical protein|uniref:DUF3883 domain-containing protein n=1 Tax=Chryseobacterium lacus TaxID=2058346 RepID=A0A368N3P1_9FLAO|nr:DUF3883 domain-containing protein [Chryseobacterium lacus]RCU43889.1 DUF3883 domain-containing protein [Chryseobacterium lacus]RST28815.1 DUF3883 domain-containing protein [Chryseobacterium lacus]
MKNKEQAIVVSYYLSRFNDDAVNNLGYKTWKDAFDDLSDKLQINKHTIKNWRDEFDPFHGHRAGWHQRQPRKTISNIISQFEQLEEFDIRQIAVEIINGNKIDLPEIDNSENEVITNPIFILRGPTGKKAEQFFIEYHRLNNLPVAGELIDSRDLGCGYDFEIKSKSYQHFIEVKGLASNIGGLLFTNKEWETAKRERSRYTVCIVSNINDSPEISFINDPFSKLNPKKNIIQTVQVQWSVSNNELQGIND